MTADRRWTVVIRLDVDHPLRGVILGHNSDGTFYTETRAREVFELMAVKLERKAARYRIMHGAEEIDVAVVGGKAMN